MEVLSRGTRVKFEGDVYTIEGVIGIDDFHVVYAAHGEDGGGPRRLLTIDDANAVEKLDDETDTLPVEKLYHYILDWESGTIHERFGYGLTLDKNSTKTRYIIFSPMYLAMLPEGKLDTVSRDYQLVTKTQDFEKASQMIREAVIERGLYFHSKLESYGELLDKLDGVEDEERNF